jgi:hypothetical protein
LTSIVDGPSLEFARSISQDDEVTRTGATRAAMALFAALLIAGAYVTPAASAAGLGAARCCAEHCAKPRTAAAASHCCPTLGADADAATLLPSANASYAPPLAGATALATALVVALRPSPAIPTTVSPRVAPIYLSSLSLRL